MIRETQEFTPDWVSPPSDTIKDLLKERGWTSVEFAEKMRLSERQIDLLLNGTPLITYEIALKLESVLGSTVKFWLNRDVQYRKKKTKRTKDFGNVK